MTNQFFISEFLIFQCILPFKKIINLNIIPSYLALDPNFDSVCWPTKVMGSLGSYSTPLLYPPHCLLPFIAIGLSMVTALLMETFIAFIRLSNFQMFSLELLFFRYNFRDTLNIFLSKKKPLNTNTNRTKIKITEQKNHF